MKHDFRLMYGVMNKKEKHKYAGIENVFSPMVF